jgi:hypothetical protein
MPTRNRASRASANARPPAAAPGRLRLVPRRAEAVRIGPPHGCQRLVCIDEPPEILRFRQVGATGFQPATFRPPAGCRRGAVSVCTARLNSATAGPAVRTSVRTAPDGFPPCARPNSGPTHRETDVKCRLNAEGERGTRTRERLGQQPGSRSVWFRPPMPHGERHWDGSVRTVPSPTSRSMRGDSRWFRPQSPAGAKQQLIPRQAPRPPPLHRRIGRSYGQVTDTGDCRRLPPGHRTLSRTPAI